MPDQRADLVRKMIAEGTSDEDIRATLKAFDAQSPQGGGVLSTAKDVAIGAAKGLGSTMAGLGEMAGNAGVIPGLAGAAGQHPIFKIADDATTASNNAQFAGKAGEQVAELLIPGVGGANAIPRTARAGQKLQKVLTAAKSAPVNVEAPGQIALRIQELAERGGTMPRMVSRFLQRTTDPTKGPVPFDEGRDFYSNISRLSGDEYNRLTGPIKREVGNLREALHGSLTQSADTVGMGDTYASGMKEYAQAAKLNAMKEQLVQGLMRAALPAASAGGAAAWAWSKLKGDD